MFRELTRGLREMLIPHMDAVEAAVYPTLERIMHDRDTSAPMRLEHEQIRRLVASVSEIVDTAERAARSIRGPGTAARRC